MTESPEQLGARIKVSPERVLAATENLNALHERVPAPDDRLALLLRITERPGFADLGEVLAREVLARVPVESIAELDEIRGIGPARLRVLVEALGEIDLDALIREHVEAAEPEPEPEPEPTPKSEPELEPEPEPTPEVTPKSAPRPAPGRPHGHVIANALRLAGDTLVVPGTSLMLDGRVEAGVAHALVGVTARAVLGPIGWLLVAAQAYAKSTSGAGLLEHLDD